MYVSESILTNYSNQLQAKNGFFVNYCPMGSGKTFAIKYLKKNKFKDKDVTVVAPYRSCRQDYEGVYDSSNSLMSDYLYPNQLIRALTHSADFVIQPSLEDTISHIEELLSELDIDWSNKVFIFDEVDFFFFQCRREFTDIIGGKIHSDTILSAIISWISQRCLILGFTATRIEETSSSKLILPHFTAYIHNQVKTSVNLASLEVCHTSKTLKVGEVFDAMIQESLKVNTPTLVFKVKYSIDDFRVIQELNTVHGKKVLIVARKENMTGTITIEETMLKSFSNLTLKKADVTLEPTGRDFICVEGENASLDKAINGNDVYEHYDYVFINISSSRQVSIPKKHEGLPVQVYSQGTKITGAMLQASARFRLNPVYLNIWINNSSKSDVLDSEDLYHRLEAIDPTVSAYGLNTGNCKSYWAGNMGTEEGKAISPENKAKNESIKHFFENYFDEKLTLISNFRNYQAKEQYEFKVSSKNTFKTHIDKLKLAEVNK